MPSFSLARAGGRALDIALARVLRRLGSAQIDLPPFSPGERWQRYLFLALANAGTVGVERSDLPLVSRMLPLSEIIGRVRLKRPGRPALISASVDGQLNPPPARRRMILDPDYFQPLPRGAVRLPYFAHPGVYEARLHERFAELRRTQRIRRLVFAGTVAPIYREKYPFPGLSRMEVIETLIAAFPEQVDVVCSPAELDTAKRPIVLSLTQDSADILGKHALGLMDYHRFLASSWFALAPPGVGMPFSHNVIEALAVSTVPLLNYADLFDPPLVSGQNCFAFTSREELTNQVRTILNLSETRLLEMHGLAAAYYTQHLDPVAAGRRLGAAMTGNGDIRLLILQERESIELYCRRTGTYVERQL